MRNFAYKIGRAVLQAIRLRYLQKEIYTYSGIVLIATNPFARVDSLYVPGMVQVYAGKQRATQAPHLFAIAEEAFMYVTATTCKSRPMLTGSLLGTCSVMEKIKPSLSLVNPVLERQ
jgi:hypothetical protein